MTTIRNQRKECLECGSPYRRGGRMALDWCKSQFCSNKCQFANYQGRAWNRAMSRPTERGCWIWPLPASGFGYGRTSLHGELMDSHRAAWKRANGPIPVGMEVLHKCDVPACVNPDHLYVGTQADNMKDRLERGRCPSGTTHPRRYLPASRFVRGTRAPNAKLTDEIVAKMRSDRPAMSYRAIARKYGVSKPTAQKACCGQSWKHVPLEVNQ